MNTVSATILNQLGGSGKLKAMLGTSTLLYGNNFLTFNLKGCRKINLVKVIYLPASDLYQIDYYKGQNLVAFDESVFCGDLKPMIESRTGLLMSLTRK